MSSVAAYSGRPYWIAPKMMISVPVKLEVTRTLRVEMSAWTRSLGSSRGGLARGVPGHALSLVAGGGGITGGLRDYRSGGGHDDPGGKQERAGKGPAELQGSSHKRRRHQ
jgi:hypothetical protein